MKGFVVHKPRTLFKSRRAEFTRSFGQSKFFVLWKDITAKIEDIERSFHLDTIKAVVQFVQSSAHLQAFDIPTGVLHLGINIPDHSGIFQQLTYHLKLDGSYPITLDPRQCHSIFKVLQLLDQQLEKQLAQKDSNSFLNSVSVNQKKVKPIVFVVQDVETFNLELLEEIILKLKIYIQKLPIVLIFGMSSKMVTLHTVLPQNILCHLGIELFQPFAVAEHLTGIIQEVILGPLPFKFGPKVFQLLVDTVFYHDFSITSLRHLIKFCLFEHLYSNKASTLCCPRDVLKKQTFSLSDDELLVFKQLPSMKKVIGKPAEKSIEKMSQAVSIDAARLILHLLIQPHLKVDIYALVVMLGFLGRRNKKKSSFIIRSNKTPEISACLAEKTEFKSLLENLLENLINSHKSFVLSLKVLSQLLKDSPDNLLKNQFCELYLLHLDKCFPAKIYRSLEKSFKFQSQKEILCNFKSCEKYLIDQECCQELLILLQELLHLMTSVDDFESSVKQSRKESLASRFELREKMQSSILLKQSKFRSICSKALNDLTNYFQNLSSPFLLPLHEVLFFDDAFVLKSHLLPSPRLLFCSALSHPSKLFQPHFSRADNALNLLPDACILFNLLLQCGRLINFQEWMENFKAASEDKTKLKKRTSKNEVNEALIIRFLHSASELQLMGFTKMAKQKRHHVIRLVFDTFS